MLKPLLLSLLLYISTAVNLLAAGDPPTKQIKGSATVLNAAQQLQLNKALAGLEQSLAANAANLNFVDEMQDMQETVSLAAESDRQVAQKLMSYLDDNPEKVKDILSLNFEDLTRLPIGLTAKLKDDARVTLGVLEAKFFPTYAEVTVFARIVFTLDNTQRDLFFGVDGIKFTRNGFVDGGGFRAVLLGDYLIPGDKWTIRLRGGSGKGDRDYDGSKTFVNFDCNDFQEASLSADVIFPRSVLLPYDVATGKEKPEGRVVFQLNEAKFTKTTGVKGILASVSVAAEDGGAFCVPGLTRFGFQINEATYDGSDGENAQSMFFPPGYEGDQDVTWKGFYMQSFSIFLPKAFREPEKDDPNIDPALVKTELQEDSLKFNQIGGTNILIDRTGFTGNVFYKHSSGKDLSAQKWEYSITGISLSFVQSQFKSGSLTGTVVTPVQEKGQSGGQITLVGTISPGDQYSLDMIVTQALPINIKAFRSKGKILAGSFVRFEYIESPDKGGQFFPSCVLSGEFTPSTKVTGTKEDIENTDIEDEEKATAKFVGLRFVNLRFQTKTAPYFGIDKFEYQRDLSGNQESKLARFPVQVDHISKYNGVFNGAQPGPNDLWIDFGFSLALAKGDIAGEGEILIKTKYNPTRGKLEFDGIGLKKIYVNASTTAFELEGFVDLYDCEEAKGFMGKLEVKLTRPFEVTVCASANFGYQKLENFRYGYVDGFFGANTPAGGIPTGLGDITVSGLGMGMYFNMKPEFYNNVSPTSCSASNINCSNAPMMTYVANHDIPFGFKVMVGLSNVTQSFDARVTIDISLSRQYGINAINLYGSGAFTSKLVSSIAGKFENIEQAFSHGLGSEVDGLTTDECQNFGDGNDDQQDVVDKANKLNGKKGYDFTQEGDIAFSIGFMLDVPSKTLHAQAEVFINKGKLRGVGPNGRVVNAVLHAGKDDLLGTNKTVFYIHLGYPNPIDARAGISYGTNIAINAYLMVGWGVPNFPPPPLRVLEYLELNPADFVKSPAEQNAIRAGTAIALGAGVMFDFEYRHNKKWVVLAQADAGFDVLMTNNDSCYPGGWLFRGQVYGYASLVALKNDEPKVNASLGFLLRGNGLKPLGVQGAVKVELKLFKIININAKVNVKVGDVC